MFCSNCGKQIPDNNKFCNHCGAQQTADNPINSAASRQSNLPQQAPPKKKNGIIVSILIMAVAFLIGKFVAAPTLLSGPDKDKGYAQQFTNDSTDKSDKKDTLAGLESHTKSFVLRTENVISSNVTFLYSGDTVTGITGVMTVYDSSVVDVDGLKKDVATAKQLVEQNNWKYINFTERSNDGQASYKYSLTFSFANLDREKKAADMAAQFIGFSAENGIIHIDTAERAMIGFGYTPTAGE